MAEGVFDNAVISQTEVDGWCILNDGKDTLRVGYVAVVDPRPNVTVFPSHGLNGVKVRNNGPSMGWAEAFTLAKLGGEEQNRTYGSIAAVGFRRAPNPARYAPYEVMELGFVMERPFEHLSNLTFELAIDTDGNGAAETFLIGTDCPTSSPMRIPANSSPRSSTTPMASSIGKPTTGITTTRVVPALHAGLHRRPRAAEVQL